MPSKRKGIFYGWWIVAISAVTMFLNGGVYYYGFSAFFLPLLQEFGWTRTAVSGAFSLSRLEGGIAAPAVGFLIDRFGPRLLMMIGFTTVGTGFILLAQVNSIEMFYIVFVVLISGGSSLGFYWPTSTAVANWFARKRTLALGIMSCGTGVGGLAVPAIAWFIGQYGWRPVAVGIGILFIASGVPLALLIRHKPEPHGYLPDGDDPLSTVEDTIEVRSNVGGEPKVLAGNAQEPSHDESRSDLGFTPRQALATRAFWTLSAVFAFRQLVNSGVAIHEIPALQDIGFSPEGAASVLAAMTILSIPGRLGFGWLADRYDKRAIITICFVMQALGLVALSYASDLFLVFGFLLFYSPAYGGLIPLMPSMYGEFFGRKSFATIAGLSQFIIMWGTILGPLIAGYTFDVSGSYEFAFLFFAVTNVVALAPLFFVEKPIARLAYQRDLTRRL